ncbi:ribonuclease HII [Neisseriaceae bacterium PsAf]|nr:ribonuclease HII [Neisseriaceae bacterium PsAf]MCV2503862.1 ribonuclease HII [Neisseriaceae bacterium]
MEPNSSYNLIAGVDEAGRGPLAGGVYAAAVILPKEYDLPNLKDSKKLTGLQREKLNQQIQNQAISFAIANASVSEIESLNILQATLLAMSRAISKLKPQARQVQIDGNQMPKNLTIPAECIIKGDSKIAQISAASILAKVARDHEMLLLDKEYPEYGFAKNKGYGTKEHLLALEKYGYISAHRKNFAPIKYMLKD